MTTELAPAAIAPPFARYAHGVLVPADHALVVVSGQLGQRADGSVPNGAREQAAICLSNIDAILAEAGMDRSDVIGLRAYVTDREHMAGYMAARDEWLAESGKLPASTLLIVSGFTRPEFKVEIEVMAAKPM